jgi:hypothetical protein
MGIKFLIRNKVFSRLTVDTVQVGIDAVNVVQTMFSKLACYSLFPGIGRGILMEHLEP